MGNDYLTDSQLKAIMPLCGPEKRKAFIPFLNLSMAYFNINTENRVAMYLAQLAHESSDLTRWVENLNYSAVRLTQVWSGRFPTIESAKSFAGNPQALANKVYNERMGNRTGSNDGWTYRGRGPIQATGREMYESITRYFWTDFKINFVENPDALLQVQWGFMASAYIFAVKKNCLPSADRRNLQECTKKINGGLNGYADRLQNYRTALAILPDNFSLKSYQTFSKEIWSDNDKAENAVRSDNHTAPDLSEIENAFPASLSAERQTAANSSTENPQINEPPKLESVGGSSSAPQTQNAGDVNASISGNIADQIKNFDAKTIPAFIPRFGKQWFLSLIPGGGLVATGLAKLSGMPDWLVFTLGFFTGITTVLFFQLIMKHREKVWAFIQKCYEITADPTLHNLVPVNSAAFVGQRREILEEVLVNKKDCSFKGFVKK